MADDTKPTEGNVSVACKLPSGLIVTHEGKTVTLNGANHKGAIAGFGITKDVDAAWIRDWAEKSQHPAVRNGSIFPNTGGKIAGEAKEKSDDIVTGMEPLNPAKPGQGIEAVPVMGG